MVSTNSSDNQEPKRTLKLVPVRTVTKHYYDLEGELQFGDGIVIRHEGGSAHEELVLSNENGHVITLDLAEGPSIFMEVYYNEKEPDGRRYLRRDVFGEVKPGEPHFDSLKEKYELLQSLRREL